MGGFFVGWVVAWGVRLTAALKSQTSFHLACKKRLLCAPKVSIMLLS
jgi:hypothetical protein